MVMAEFKNTKVQQDAYRGKKPNKNFKVKSLSFRPDFARAIEQVNDNLEKEIEQKVGATALITAMLEVVLSNQKAFAQAKNKIIRIKRKQIMRKYEVFK